MMRARAPGHKDAGAAAFVAKPMLPDTLLTAIRQVARHTYTDRYVKPADAERAVV